MKVAIMQPYFFPYIGYWQLIHAVDRFVVYDDVNYIKRGWVNRNRLLINGQPSFFTIPLVSSSQNKRICDLHMQPTIIWRQKLAKTVENTYRKSPYFPEIFPTIEKILYFDSNSLADFLSHQIKSVLNLLGIKTEIVTSSRVYDNCSLAGKDRILDICKQENTSIYINLPGGRNLYHATDFNDKEIKLAFLSVKPIHVNEKKVLFAPYLSIIDLLMKIGISNVIENALLSYELSTTN